MNSQANVTKVIARAGSGKTTFIVNAIKQLDAEGKLGGKYGAIVLVFSIAARDDFRRRLETLTKALSSTQVMTLHCLAGKLSGSAARSVEFVIWKAVQELEKPECEAVGAKTCTKKLKHIFVDEAQDLSPTQFALVEQLRRATRANATFVGDDKQCIYQFQGSDCRLIGELRAEASLSLSTNYRSQAKILDLANAIGECAMKAHRQEHGAPPVFVTKGRAQLSDAVVKIAAEALVHGSVAVVGPVKVGKKENLGLQSVRNALEVAGVPTETHYSLANDARQIPQTSMSDAVVHMLTIHASKGLEFDTVVLIDAHHKLQNKLPQESDAELHRNLIYVAVTRARNRLFICVNAEAQISPYIDSVLHLCAPFVQDQPLPIRGDYKYRTQKSNTVEDVVTALLTRGNLGLLEPLLTGAPEERKRNDPRENSSCSDAEAREVVNACLTKLFKLRVLGVEYFDDVRAKWETVAIISDTSEALARESVCVEGKDQLFLLRDLSLSATARMHTKRAVTAGRTVLLTHVMRREFALDIVRQIGQAFERILRPVTRYRNATSDRRPTNLNPGTRNRHRSQDPTTRGLRLVP